MGERMVRGETGPRGPKLFSEVGHGVQTHAMEPISLSVEGASERGKLWCLVHHMWKVLKPWCSIWCASAL